MIQHFQNLKLFNVQKTKLIEDRGHTHTQTKTSGYEDVYEDKPNI